MWPWGHLAVGYLLLATVTRYRDLEVPSDGAVLAVTLGTQLPDLVDKPLAYWTVLLPEGRSLTHSLVVAVPVCAVVGWLAWRSRYRRVGTAFAIGYLTHLLGDAGLDLLALDVEMLSFLVWPLLRAPDYEAAGFAHHLAQLEGLVKGASALSPEAAYFVFQAVLFVVMLVAWAEHRFPPLPGLRARVRGGLRAE